MSAPLPRILMVNNTCSLSAGTTRSLLLILKHLRKHYSFEVAVRPDSDGLPSVLLGEGIPFHPLGFLPGASFRRLVALMRKREFDAVYANCLENATRESFWAAKFVGRPIVWHVREPIAKPRLAWTVRFADAIVANSEHTADRIMSACRCRKPITIPNGVEQPAAQVDGQEARRALLDELRWPASSFVVINVGTLSARKNQLDAVTILKQVTSRHARARLACLGGPADAEYVDRIRAAVGDPGHSDEVKLLGHRSNVHDYLRGADLLLHTSVIEPQGRVILEAMAAELPVVAYRVGGVPEAVVEGETGYLVPSGDTNAAAEAIRRLIDDPALRLRMGRKGHARVMQHFTAEATARRVDDVIQSVLLARRQADAVAR